MRILHVGEYVNGGVATYIRTLLQHNDSSIEQFLLLSRYKSEKFFDGDKKNIFYYKYKRAVKYIPFAMWSIHQEVKRIKPDLIHVHSTWAGLLVRLPYLFLPKKNIRIVYSSHGWSFLMDVPDYKKNFYAFVEKILSRVTDKIINISAYEQKQAIENGFSKKNMVMVYNGVIESKKRGDFRTAENLIVDKNKINLLFVGRLDRQKGLDIFLSIYNSQDYNNIHLYVIGSGVLDNIVLKNDEKITYLGWVDRDQIDYYYDACDALIMPSRWEGFGLTAAEAMRNEKPVIASNQGALPELIDHEVNGYIFDLNNLASLMKILNNLNKDVLKNLGINARAKYECSFTAEKMKKETVDLYKQLLVNLKG